MPGNSPDRESEGHYFIDETVELQNENEGHRYIRTWDLEEDLRGSSEYILRVISRSNINVNCYVIPEEEVDFFEKGDNFVNEFRSYNSSEHQASFQINGEDEDPYHHSGDFVLAIEGESRSEPPRVTVKVRESDE